MRIWARSACKLGCVGTFKFARPLLSGPRALVMISFAWIARVQGVQGPPEAVWWSFEGGHGRGAQEKDGHEKNMGWPWLL